MERRILASSLEELAKQIFRVTIRNRASGRENSATSKISNNRKAAFVFPKLYPC